MCGKNEHSIPTPQQKAAVGASVSLNDEDAARLDNNINTSGVEGLSVQREMAEAIGGQLLQALLGPGSGGRAPPRSLRRGLAVHLSFAVRAFRVFHSVSLKAHDSMCGRIVVTKRCSSHRVCPGLSVGYENDKKVKAVKNSRLFKVFRVAISAFGALIEHQ
jgi:hypothetical protein